MPQVVVAGKNYQPAVSVLFWTKQLLAAKGPVLDYGTGLLRNARFLKSLGLSVWAIELPRQIARIKATFGGEQLDLEFLGLPEELLVPSGFFGSCVCTYVLNIVSQEEKECIIDRIANSLQVGGLLCLEVRKRSNSHFRNCLSRQEIEGLTTCRGFKLIAEREGTSYLAHLYRFGG